jgi:replicative DNA helicase
MIYRAMLRLSGRGVTVDLTAVDADLDARGETDEAGGTAYLAQLMDWAFYGMNVVAYVGIVRDRAKRRKLARWCEKLEDELLGAHETEELLSKAHEQILALCFDSGGGRLPFVAAKEAAVRAFGEIDCQAANPKKFTLCVSGIKCLDQATAGFRPKEQIVICGETSHLKTVLAQQIVRETAKRLSGRQRVLIFSPEMPAEAIMKRQMAATTGVPTSQLRRPWSLGSNDLTKLSRAANENDPLFLINDERPLTFERMRAVSELAASRYELVLVVIDYVQLVRYPGKSDLERDSLLAVDTYELAENLRVPVIILSQLTKPVQSFRRFARKKNSSEEDLIREQWQCRPTRWDIKGHGALGETPHIIIGTHRHFLHLQDSRGMAEKFRGKAELCLLKMRDGGGVGTMEVAFDEELLVLADLRDRADGGDDSSPNLFSGVTEDGKDG